MNSQCENFWNLETKYVAGKKKTDLFELMLSCNCCSILQNDIWWKDIWDKIQNYDDTGNKHEPHVIFTLLYAIYET